MVTCPTGQIAHALVDKELYCPAAHAVHAVAPGANSVLVVEPAAHSAQGVVGTRLYCPGAHTVQLVAPRPAFVVQPA